MQVPSRLVQNTRDAQWGTTRKQKKTQKNPNPQRTLECATDNEL